MMTRSIPLICNRSSIFLMHESKGYLDARLEYLFGSISKTFLIENDTDYLVTNFRNEQYCFDVKMRLEDLGKLVGLKHKNRVAYPVELYDLKWSLEKENGKTEILYLDMHRIID